MSYERVITNAAAWLEHATRRNAGISRTYVATVPIFGLAHRRAVIVISDSDTMPDGAAIIRPCDNGASTFTQWESVPYSEMRHILWHAMRREPVLPEPCEA